MGLIYLDSCLVIYIVEPNPKWSSRVNSLIVEARSSLLAISPLVMAECLVGPLRRSNAALEREYSAAFQRYSVLPMPEDVFLKAAYVRSKTGLKLPDALHVACAQYHGCTEFWTNDNRLSAFGDWVRVLTPA